MTFRAHFDGTVIVPDEPVDLPVGKPLAVDVEETATAGASPRMTDGEIQAALTALDELLAHGVTGTNIPAEMLRREHLYGDDGR